MALIDVVKCDSLGANQLAWKYPAEDLSLGAQLIVNEGMSAVFVKGGQALDVFHAGTYTLSSANLPLLDKLINLPFGGQTPFTAEVWFVSTADRRNYPWGTSSPIQIFDPTVNIPVSVRAYGNWGARVTDPVQLLAKVIGVSETLTGDSLIQFINGELIRLTSDLLSEKVLAGMPILQANSQLNELSDELTSVLRASLAYIGVDITIFNIQNISIPPEEMTRLQEIYASVFEAEKLSKVQLSGSYSTVKGLQVLSDSANNSSDGGAGGLMAAGLGVGAALPLGGSLGSAIAGGVNSASSEKGPLDVLRDLKAMLDEGLIDQDSYDEKRNEILSRL